MDLPMVPSNGDVCLSRGCSDCCHDTEMVLTEDDLGRLQAARPGEDFWSYSADGFMQLRVRDAPSAPCWFLEAGRCSVWEQRPEGCRLYPAVWDDEADHAHLDTQHCPHTDQFRIPKSTQDAVRRLANRLYVERDERIALP